ncbi:hypothetical protein BC938DRAFT_471758 [Jimgerdemannia flammicorona]|uniref:Nucleoporin Nup133/Nup155-like N-terminal domain-containing protein n=1 Tax=Jimgerdemannia flammicorona TaxID=994334 RepID=A0A433QUK3_9FUNG|nr:hypothetical protein BC938DRAFT_471758 [Jimgerdemannia flammicorona]
MKSCKVLGLSHYVETKVSPSNHFSKQTTTDGRVDFYQHAYGARVDPTIGYALVWTKSHAFVWFYQRVSPPSFSLLALSSLHLHPIPLSQHAVPTLPTCFIFPLPQITVPGKPIPPLPLVVIVPPLDRNREPGLIACSVDGEIRYWEAVSLALSSPDRFSSVRLYLNEGENITVFNVVEEGIYILGTSHTRLLRVTLDPRLQSSALAKPVGVLARVGNLLGYRDPDATNEELEVARRVVAIVPGVRVEMREQGVACDEAWFESMRAKGGESENKSDGRCSAARLRMVYIAGHIVTKDASPLMAISQQASLNLRSHLCAPI